MADDTRTETGMSDKDLLDTARRWTGRGELVAGVVVDQLMRIIDGKLPTMPLSRQCPKCRSEMHRSYHDSRHPCGRQPCDQCHQGGHTRCPGGRTEHLLWTCGCGFEETTPCADAEVPNKLAWPLATPPSWVSDPLTWDRVVSDHPLLLHPKDVAECGCGWRGTQGDGHRYSIYRALKADPCADADG